MVKLHFRLPLPFLHRFARLSSTLRASKYYTFPGYQDFFINQLSIRARLAIQIRTARESCDDRSINAFIYDATVLDFLASHDDKCKLRTVGNWYAMTGYGIGFPKGSKWRERINKYMVQLQYEGETTSWKDESGIRSSNSDHGVNYKDACIDVIWKFQRGVGCAIMCE